ncbi:MAG: 50S ribosomal protein L1 [Dehalococcoidales bacterium]|nr:50S ribosomal protein L1 [Dehalococcoidales bacterium]
MAERGKKYNETSGLVDKDKAYLPQEAVELAKKTATAKFDETLELHLRMGVDPRNAQQQVRGVALLPYGLGKKVRVLVFAQGEAERIATSAGADVVGNEDVIKQIEGGWLEFDAAIATPDMMGKVGKLGKVLGRKGLMPNPKSGTVVAAEDLPRVIGDARKGRVEFKLDRSAIIHLPVGKMSFDADKLNANLMSVIEAVIKSKPVGAKGQYIKSAYITSTMGPGIKLDIRNALNAAVA